MAESATEILYRQREAHARLAKPMAQVKVAMKSASIAASQVIFLSMPNGWAWRAWFRHQAPPPPQSE